MDAVLVVVAGLVGVAIVGFLVGGVLAASRRSHGYLASGHAHNDYAHVRPLASALRYGYASVETDVWPVDGELLVGHSRAETSPDRTLRRLYLDPLAERVRRDGYVHEGQSLQLLVEFKTDPAGCYRMLTEQLADHAFMLTRYRAGTVTSGAVTVVVTSSAPPYREVAAADDRFVFCDGTLRTLQRQDWPPEVAPLASEKWDTHFSWRGAGPMPAAQRDALRDMVRRAHEAGRAIRFYGLPGRPGRRRAVWRELRGARVDYVAVDSLRAYRSFAVAGRHAGRRADAGRHAGR